MSVYAHEYGHYIIDAIVLKEIGYEYNKNHILVFLGVANGNYEKLISEIEKSSILITKKE